MREMLDTLRGHEIYNDDARWRYSDTGEETAGNERPCGYCGIPNTPDGHDGCLGTLPGVMNACCGHGVVGEAYVQFDTERVVQGSRAVALIETLRPACEEPVDV